MEFNRLVIDILLPFFKKYNFHVEDQYENYIKLKSKRVEIIISHNELDKTNSLSLVVGKGFSYPIDENVLKQIFQCDVKIDNVIPEFFVKNLSVFFEDKGKTLLEGDVLVLESIVEYVQKKSHEYTSSLLNSQDLAQADRAWEDTDYRGFIKYIDTIGILNVLPSYQLKYRIAQKKLRHSK